MDVLNDAARREKEEEWQIKINELELLCITNL